jgi:hypothetical protein
VVIFICSVHPVLLEIEPRSRCGGTRHAPEGTNENHRYKSGYLVQRRRLVEQMKKDLYSVQRTEAEDIVHPRVLMKYKNSVALVRERTIAIERLPLVGEVSANFCG